MGPQLVPSPNVSTLFTHSFCVGREGWDLGLGRRQRQARRLRASGEPGSIQTPSHGGPRPPLRTLDNEVRRTRSPQRVSLLAAAALGGFARNPGVCPSATHSDQLRPPGASAAQAQTQPLLWEPDLAVYVITRRRRRWVPGRRSERSRRRHAGLGQMV